MAEPTYSFYTNAYLKTHTELVQQSIMMAQREFETQLQQIQFYEKQISKMKYGTADGKSTFQTKPELVYRSKKDFRDAKQKEIDAVEEQTSNLPIDLVSAKNIAKKLLGGGKSQAETLQEIVQVQGLAAEGSSLYQKRLIAKRLVNAVASAAAEKGQSPKLTQLNNAAKTALAVDGFDASVDILKAREIESRQKAIKEIGTSGTKKDSTGGKSADLDFSMSDVIDTDGKLSFKDGISLTVEQERIYRLQDKLNKMNTNFEQSYGEDFSIDDMIERGRDIYRKNYAPISKKELDTIYRTNFLETLNPQQTNLFIALESVKPNDRRVKDYFSGNYTSDEQLFSTIDTIVQAGTNGQMIDPAELVNSIYPDDPDKAREALGVAMQVQMQNLGGKNIKPMKEEKVPNPVEDTKDDDIINLDPLEAAREGIKDFFASRTRGKDKVEVEETVIETPNQEDVIFDESGGLVNPSVPVTEVPAIDLSEIRVGLNEPLLNTKSYNYAVQTYDEAGNPIFVETVGGKSMNQAMIDEAQIAYDKQLLKLLNEASNTK